MFSIVKDEWDVLITDDIDYVNFSHLTAVNDLCLDTWSKNTTIEVIMKHLEDLGMDPTYVFEDQLFVKIELLHTILSPIFMMAHTPPVPDFFTRDLIDLKISQAKERMGKEFPCINLSERRFSAVGKVDATCFLLNESEERLTVLQDLQALLHHISKDLSSESCWKNIDLRMLETSYTVREISPQIIKLRQLEADPAKRAEAMAALHKDLRDLNSAIRCEIAIRKVNYRLMLSQLMIHEAFTMSVEGLTKAFNELPL